MTIVVPTLASASVAPTPLYEDFNHLQGDFPGYDTYDFGQRTQIIAQKHVDIRSFKQSDVLLPFSMFDLDEDAMSSLDALTMAQLEAGDLFQRGENWTAGVVGPQADRNHFNGISLTCPIGTTTTSSVSHIVDISSFSSPDFISVSLPAFALLSITTASSFLDLTSEPSGNFATGPTDSLSFSSSSIALLNGNCEARFPLSLLTHIDRTKITGVRFRIQASAPCTFRCLSIRCLATSWKYAPLDQDTLYDRLGATVPPTGNITQPYAFPTTAITGVPPEWPILLRSDGSTDPELMDIEIGAVIETGLNTSLNTFALYFREYPMVPRSMLAMDALMMSDLDGLGKQPDFTPAHLNDFLNTKYLTASIQWGTSGSVHIADQSGSSFDFTGITLAPNSNYYFLVTLLDNSIRAHIYLLDAAGNINPTPVFDSTAVVDSAFIPRRAGRIGWYAKLLDGDTYVQTIRPRSVVYREYRSLPLRSHIPIEGAQLFANSTPNLELYEGLTGTTGVAVSLDTTKSNSGQCLQIRCPGQRPLEGVVFGPIRFENLGETKIEFDVLTTSEVTFAALLMGEGRLVSLYIPNPIINQWTHMVIPLDLVADQIQPGVYSTVLVQLATATNTWFLDHMSVPTRAVSWQGRGQAADPWKMNDPNWIKFEENFNDPFDGTLLGRGNALQIRGQAIQPGAVLDQLKVLPKYSTLGRFVWTDNAPVHGAAPVPSFITSSIGQQVSCDGRNSVAADGIGQFYWTFGDGTYKYGSTVVHTYLLSGTYTINLTVIDTLGQKASTTQSVTV